MEAPLVLSTNIGHPAQMVVALVVGGAFGLVLERAGFGRADNIAATFYGRDFRMMRVMFAAVMTSMLGVYLLDLTGVMPVGNIGLLPTFVLPALVGGALVGTGMVVGGYCPGTSVVATMSGKLDGLFYIVGLCLGTVLFTVSYDWFAAFHGSTAMGRVLLHEYFGLPSAVMVMLVALFAVGALWAVGRIEALVRARSHLDPLGAQDTPATQETAR